MADILLRPCPECGATTPGYGPSQWCYRCERNDIARVLRRDGGVSEPDALRLADLLMERDPKPITSRDRYEAIRLLCNCVDCQAGRTGIRDAVHGDRYEAIR